MMKKKLLALALCLLAATGSAALAFANESEARWNVTFTSSNRLDSDYTDAALSRRVFEMQPGDAVNLTLTLHNDNPAAANWYMTNKVLQSLEESSAAASGGAYEYELVYTPPGGGEPEELFSSDTVGGELTAVDRAAQRVGLKNATDGLEEFFYLDTLQPGEEALLNLRVALDGETQGNSYQNTLARLQLNFAVDTTVERTENERVPGLRVVQTGDSDRALPFLIAAGVSGLLLLLVALFGLKERRQQQKKSTAAKKLASLLLVGLLFGAQLPGLFTARAAEADAPVLPATTYTVRLFPGAQGSIDPARAFRVLRGAARTAVTPQVEQQPGGVVAITGLQYGDEITFLPQQGVTLSNGSKYYIRGVRESGYDNSAVASPSFPVTGDLDYVVAYGIQGETVAYTVQFQDENGAELAPPQTYRGNVGDKPVVAYQYIEGYRPQAYNLGKTLVADAAENLFTFTYSPIPVNVVTETIIEPAPGVELPPAPAPAPEGPGGEEIPDDPTPLVDPYQDLDEIEDEGTPLGFLDAGRRLGQDFAVLLADLPLPVRAAIAICVMALILLLFWVITRKRKKKDAAKPA